MIDRASIMAWAEHAQPRYSEDIDLVQINPGPIKPILFRLGED